MYRGTRQARRLTIIAVLAIVAASSYAFTASNTVPGSVAGSGSGTISGYTVTGVSYTLNATTPTNIDAVAFTVDQAPPAGSTIKIKLVASGSTFYTCSNVTTAVTCNTTVPQATVSSADQLLVVAAQ